MNATHFFDHALTVSLYYFTFSFYSLKLCFSFNSLSQFDMEAKALRARRVRFPYSLHTKEIMASFLNPTSAPNPLRTPVAVTST